MNGIFRGTLVKLTPYGKDAQDSWDRDGTSEGDILNYLNDAGSNGARIFQIADYCTINEGEAIGLIRKMIKEGLIAEESANVIPSNFNQPVPTLEPDEF